MGLITPWSISPRHETLIVILNNKHRLINGIVNKKKYTAKTNKKGVATVKVKLSKKKTYTFTVKFAGDKTYVAVKKTGKVVIK